MEVLPERLRQQPTGRHQYFCVPDWVEGQDQVSIDGDTGRHLPRLVAMDNLLMNKITRPTFWLKLRSGQVKSLTAIFKE